MKILALETDTQKLKQQFISDGENEVLMTYYHALSFLFAIIKDIFVTITLFVTGVIAWQFSLPMGWVVGFLFIVWFLFVFFNVLKSWIDWRYDFILVTTDKLVLVDQTSIIRQKVNPIHLENIGSVSAETMYWDIFGFGKIVVALKEGEGGQNITLKFVPNAGQVAAKISQTVTYYQRYVDGSGTAARSPFTVDAPAKPLTDSDLPPQATLDQTPPAPQSPNQSA